MNFIQRFWWAGFFSLGSEEVDFRPDFAMIECKVCSGFSGLVKMYIPSLQSMSPGFRVCSEFRISEKSVFEVSLMCSKS